MIALIILSQYSTTPFVSSLNVENLLSADISSYKNKQKGVHCDSDCCCLN
jgi:hypothetical protein